MTLRPHEVFLSTSTSCYRMFMPKDALSVTLEEANLLWLRGRATARKKRSLSETLDEILTEARAGGAGADAIRSVVGTIDIADVDPGLELADEAVGSLFTSSLDRPFLVKEDAPVYGAAPPDVKTTTRVAKRRG